GAAAGARGRLESDLLEVVEQLDGAAGSVLALAVGEDARQVPGGDGDVVVRQAGGQGGIERGAAGGGVDERSGLVGPGFLVFGFVDDEAAGPAEAGGRVRAEFAGLVGEADLVGAGEGAAAAVVGRRWGELFRQGWAIDARVRAPVRRRGEARRQVVAAQNDVLPRRDDRLA